MPTPKEVIADLQKMLSGRKSWGDKQHPIVNAIACIETLTTPADNVAEVVEKLNDGFSHWLEWRALRDETVTILTKLSRENAELRANASAEPLAELREQHDRARSSEGLCSRCGCVLHHAYYYKTMSKPFCEPCYMVEAYGGGKDTQATQAFVREQVAALRKDIVEAIWMKSSPKTLVNQMVSYGELRGIANRLEQPEPKE